MEKKSPSMETLTELGILAMETKCSCRICQKLRQITYAEMKTTIYLLKGPVPSGTAITELDLRNALQKDAKKEITELRLGVS